MTLGLEAVGTIKRNAPTSILPMMMIFAGVIRMGN